MEFWGTEVAPGKPQLNSPGEDTYCHVSQAALGPSKDGKSERVVIRVETGENNVVLGTLVAGKVDQMSLDLIFDRDFKLSHTGTSASVFFCGYKTEKGGEGDYTSDEESEDDEEDDEEVLTAVAIKENGSAAGKDTPKIIKKAKESDALVEAKPKKADKQGTGLLDLEASEGFSDEDEDDEDDEEAKEAMKSDVKMDFGSDDYDEDDDSEFEMDDDLDSEGDSDELDDEESDEDEDSDDLEENAEDVAVEVGKKRAQISSAQKSPVAGGKKARVDTPAKPGSKAAADYWESLIVAGSKGLITTPGKKAAAKAGAGGKIAEAKESVAKTPAKDKEASPKTPKSVGDSAKKLGAHSCADCDRSFASLSALAQHATAKHKK